MNTSTTSVVQYAIVTTPAASYEITFPYYTLSDIQAVLTLSDGTTETLTIDEDYTLSAVGNSGTLTRVGTWTAGATRITIARIASFIQDVNFINNAVLNAETLETLFDRIVAYIQQTNGAINRTVTIPITDDAATLELPAKAVRANKALAFDADGNAVPSEYTSAVISTFMATLLQKTNTLDSQKYLELLPSGATKAISAIVQDFLNTGGTSEGTASKVIRRDENGRAQVAEPSADADIAVKKTVTDHTSATYAHDATSLATASRLIIRDGNGRAKVAEPSADGDIATKKTVADAIALKTDQELKTTSSPTFADATVATKLLSTYLGHLNQGVKSTDYPSFGGVVAKPYYSTILSTFASPGTAPRALVFNGTNLISCDHGSDLIYIHDGISATILSSFATPGSQISGMAFDGTNLISCDEDSDLIYIHDGITSTILSSFASPGIQPRGLAFDGTNLISCDANTDLIYIHDGISSTILSSFATPATNIYSIAFDGINLFSSDYTTELAYIHDGISATIIDSFTVSGIFMKTIGTDGSHLLSTDFTTDSIRVHQKEIKWVV